VNVDGTIPIAEFLGLRPAAEHPDGVWVGEMPALPHTLNLSGVVHGGATATLIDWAAGWGIYHLTGRSGSTTDVFIRYLAPAREGSTLRATTTIDRAGASTIAATVRVTDDADRLIAVGNIAYVVTRRPA
jgi:uncharacterized protein (TIGR00369 family)